MVEYLIKSAVVLAVMLAIYQLFLQKDANFAFNRWYLLFAGPLSVLLPLLEVPITNWWASLVPAKEIIWQNEFVLMLEESITVVVNEQETVNYWFIGYVVIALLLLTRVVFKLIQLRSYIFKNKDKIIRNEHYKLLNTGGEVSTSSFFQYLFWDDTLRLSEEEHHQIMLHEEAHIRLNHSTDKLIAEALCAVFWFNPLFLILRRLMSDNHEYQADQVVKLQFADSSYPRLLAREALGGQMLLAGNYFNSSQTLKRIKMMKMRKKWPGWAKVALTVPFLVFVVYLVSCTEQGPNVDGEVFMKVEVMPVPQNGLEGFYKELSKNLIYPEAAKEQGIEGKVFVQFVVTSEGELAELEVVRGFDADCDQAALDALKASPKWIPGSVKGENVNTRMVMPITFSLNHSDGMGAKMDLNGNSTKAKYPKPVIGKDEFMRSLGNAIRYPKEARANKVQGIVYARCIISNGKIAEVKVGKELGFGLEDEVRRALLAVDTEWAVESSDLSEIIIPFKFKLDGEPELVSNEDDFKGLIIIGYSN